MNLLLNIPAYFKSMGSEIPAIKRWWNNNDLKQTREERRNASEIIFVTANNVRRMYSKTRKRKSSKRLATKMAVKKKIM